VAVGTAAALQSQSAWSSKYFVPISCEATSPVLAGGGPSGGTIGVLENEGPGVNGAGSEGLYYRTFSPATTSFGAPVLVSDEGSLGDTDVSASQDSTGGVYASWEDGRGIVLDYSATGGASWPTPRAVPLASGPSDAVVAGGAHGAAVIAYTANTGAGTHEYVVAVPYGQLAADR